MRKKLQLFEGVEGRFCYLDDVLIFGKDQKEHDRRLETVMNIVVMSGIRLNTDNCLFRPTKLKFLCHRFTADGIVADPEKVAAILDMPDIQSVTRPLNNLRKDNTVWAWGPGQEEAFVKMKMLVASTPILAYYDATKPNCVSADASSYGIGCHGGGRMKLHSSRMLTPFRVTVRTNRKGMLSECVDIREI